MALSLDEIRRFLFKQLAPTIARVNGMVKRGVIRRVTDSTRLQSLQLSLLDDELADEVEHLQPFGVSFMPPTGAEVVALAVGGNSDHLVALGTSSRAHRPRARGLAGLGGGGGTGAPLEAGEGGLYGLDGWKVFIDSAGVIYLGSDVDAQTAPVAMAPATAAVFTRIRDAIQGATPVPNDGGAALKAAILLALGVPNPDEPEAEPGPAFPGDIGASKVRAL